MTSHPRRATWSALPNGLACFVILPYSMVSRLPRTWVSLYVYFSHKSSAWTTPPLCTSTLLHDYELLHSTWNRWSRVKNKADICHRRCWLKQMKCFFKRLTWSFVFQKLFWESWFDFFSFGLLNLALFDFYAGWHWSYFLHRTTIRLLNQINWVVPNKAIVISPCNA